MSTREDYHGLWRSSAYEAVKYTDDFPEALLVLPELIDGAIGQGKATKVSITATWITETNIHWTIADNGRGLQNQRRFLSWSASKSVDNLHRNGHGSKKALTKFAPEYSTALWSVQFRNTGRNLTKITGPFLGPYDTSVDEIPEDNTTLMPSGTEFCIQSDSSILKKGGYDSADKLLKGLEDLICSRYSDELLERVEFVIKIQNSYRQFSKTISSFKEKWRSFHWHVKQAVIAKEAVVVCTRDVVIPGAIWTYTGYKLTVNGASTFPLKSKKYGQKNMPCSRVHVALDGRTIEAIPYYELMGREANHNDFNGCIGFVNFRPNTPEDFAKVPMPCTTKVSFYENDPPFLDFKRDIRAIIGDTFKKSQPISSSRSVQSDSEGSSGLEEFNTPSRENPIVQVVPAKKKIVKKQSTSIVQTILAASNQLQQPSVESTPNFPSLVDILPEVIPLVIEQPKQQTILVQSPSTFEIRSSEVASIFVKDTIEVNIPGNHPDLLTSYFLANTEHFTQEDIYLIAQFMSQRRSRIR